MDGSPPTAADRPWIRVFCRVREVSGAQIRQYSIQTSQREANGEGEVPLFPTSRTRDLKLMLDDMNATTIRVISATQDLFKNMRTPDLVTELELDVEDFEVFEGFEGFEQADDDSDQADGDPDQASDEADDDSDQADDEDYQAAVDDY